MSVCRHCNRLAFDGPSYASTLVAGEAMPKLLADLESRIIPCVTAVCPRCERISVLSDGSQEAALETIFMWQRLKEWIDK